MKNGCQKGKTGGARASQVPSVQRMNVVPTTREIYGPWLTDIHYAGRIPPIEYAFALEDEGHVVGVVTFGPPASPQIARSVMPDAKDRVLELNRLVLMTDKKNAASILVGGALRQLPEGKAVVSYADGRMGHVGYIYQATNFFFAGSAKAHDAEYIVNGVPTHPRTLASRGITDPKRWARENGIEVREPQPKNRYVFFTGGKKHRREAEALCRWPLSREYPKGETHRYDIYCARPQ